MKKMSLSIIFLLVVSYAVNAQDANYFENPYSELVKTQEFVREVVELVDSLDISYLSDGYYAERNNGGSGFMVVLPKDTTYSKICNLNKFSLKERMKRNEIVQSQKQALIDAALSKNVEDYFDVYFFYFKQESLYAEGGAVDDNGVEWPDWGPKDNAPLEVYKLQNGHWEFQYIQNRTKEPLHYYGRAKANEILKARFGKMAEEIERK